jgi:hypothetical protein
MRACALDLGTPSKKLKSQAELPWHDAYVNAESVKAIVDLVPRVTEDGPECQGFVSIMKKEFYACDHMGVIRKLVLIDYALMVMAHTLCKDTGTDRCTKFPGVTVLSTIVQPILLPDERVTVDCVSGVRRMLRPEREFKVNDTLTFNLVFRRLQCNHPSWPGCVMTPRAFRGTKGVTDALDFVGMGPALRARGRAVTSDPAIRGPLDTDPNVRHPDGPRPDGKQQRETDGLYYREYTFTQDRCEMAASRQKRGTPMVVGEVL